jgi:NAD+--asparagine ADP-ribosyltransferase
MIIFRSIIIEKLFQFTKKKSLMESFNAIDSNTLNEMAQNTIASHVYDSFSKSKSIDLEIKKNIFKKLSINTLIRNAYGSRVFESFWFELEWSAKERESIVEKVFLPLLASTVSFIV